MGSKFNTSKTEPNTNTIKKLPKYIILTHNQGIYNHTTNKRSMHMDILAESESVNIFEQVAD